MVATLALKETSSDFMSFENIIWTFPDYALSLGTSLAKVGR